ncbi:putative Glycosyl hydrolases family 25 [Monocercomonoides exilis]|uniref:putative Glycosyl hydrolases family 25 n=1 Tax=Monocercomonoides exilis TaxID=2049356 RepID=UPI00355946E8|nr:putative Glycosyl hydrolases family 25 [Monocercomonoides exilis]|eukprot:MONOS_1264.1-p1 / transcript=MONOS_1264.1 / gene=MONOS_1264 / organism=Monocercomonoides_exilis_PA203 / gene_product=unspecified product / transcript_product=unspecified product / location=Mono_scaffold00021:191288-192055(-) / protein_length=255 / sequence_SO=supercontig / SO=protein_coding / is_pseudo=false
MFFTLLYFFSFAAHCAGELEIGSHQSNALQYVLDLSVWEQSFNAPVAKSKGIAAVLCRTSYGNKDDNTFLPFTNAAYNAGIGAGAYVYATWHYNTVSSNYNQAVANAKSQANHFISRLKSTHITSYVALDMEMEPKYSTVLSASQMTEISNMFMDMVKSAGYKVVLYANGDWIFNRLITNNIKYPIWCAYYFKYGTAMDFPMWDGSLPNTTMGKKLQSIKSKIMMWQFTDEGFGKKYGLGSTDCDKSYAYVNMKF